MTKLPKVKKPVPAPVEACEGGLLADTNARTLLRAAVAAGNTGAFGAAEGLAVLAIEEAVKARVLFAPLFALKIGAPNGITDELLRVLLHGPRSHTVRHMMAALQSIRIEPARMAVMSKLDEDELAAIDHLMSGNARKERGFYVDLTGSGWSSPASVSEADWLTARTFAEKFVSETAAQAERAERMLVD